MSITALLLNGLIFYIPAQKHARFYSGKNIDLVLISFLITILSLTFFFILTQTPFKQKYLPTKMTWLTVVVITFLVLLDRTLIYIVS